MEEETRQAAVSPRRTRQRTKLAKAAASTTLSQADGRAQISVDETCNSGPISCKEENIRALPEILDTNLKLKDLDKKGIRLLLKKRQLLRDAPVAVPEDMERRGLVSSVMATLVFAQEEAGTAVCISPHGILLTCSHCIAETAEEFDESRSHWLLFASGQAVEAKPMAWDSKRDLALLKIVAAQATTATAQVPPFPFVTPAPSPPPLKSRLICIGHPGSEDLEVEEPGTKTGYDVLHLSTGTFRGCADGQDPQNNEEIGALMHTCWTYWGHSGAPLVERQTGRLVGLHSSWDDETGMRRGVALEAILEFLEENKGYL